MGEFVEVAKKPSWNSVQEYKEYIKNNAPNTDLKRQMQQSEIECTCCGQGAPSEVAALIKCLDKTPTSIQLQGNRGEQLWLCADCFTIGVRPKFVKFGKIHWNKEGRRIKKRKKSDDWDHW